MVESEREREGDTIDSNVLNYFPFTWFMLLSFNQKKIHHVSVKCVDIDVDIDECDDCV